MVDARAIDVHNALAQNRCNIIFCTCFQPNCCCEFDYDDTCGYSKGLEKDVYRGFGYGSRKTPPPQTCLCPDDYKTSKISGSKPCSRVIEKTKTHTNHLLVPVNVSKDYVSELYERKGEERFIALNELTDNKNNLTWRDGVCDKRTSTAEHLTSFAHLAGQESRDYVSNLLDKYVPK